MRRKHCGVLISREAISCIVDDLKYANWQSLKESGIMTPVGLLLWFLYTAVKYCPITFLFTDVEDSE